MFRQMTFFFFTFPLLQPGYFQRQDKNHLLYNNVTPLSWIKHAVFLQSLLFLHLNSQSKNWQYHTALVRSQVSNCEMKFCEAIEYVQ